MPQHIVRSFDEELGQISQTIREMADLGGVMVQKSIRALLDCDQELARQVIADDLIMDARQRELDERAITIIARRQPMAQDLRVVVGAIRMAADFERVGDLAKNTAKRTSAIGESVMPHGLSHSLDTMSAMVLKQVGSVVDYYVAHDAAALEQLRVDDEKIDIQYTAIFRELLTYMMEDPRNISACTHLLFCAKNLERIGDHVTNIAENAYYMITGEQLSLKRPKVDEIAQNVHVEYPSTQG